MAIPSVGILIIKNDKVLLVRNEAGSGYSNTIYGLPSGRVNIGETEIEAAARELGEETGFHATEDDLAEFPGNYFIKKLYNRKLTKERGAEFSWRVFLCQKYAGTLKTSPETTPMWVPINKLPDYYLMPNIKEVVSTGLKFLNNNL